MTSDRPAAWLQISRAADPASAERCAAALSAAGAVAVTLRDGGDQPIYEPAPGATELWTQTRVAGLFPPGSDPDTVCGRAARALGSGTAGDWRVEHLMDQEWVEAWREHFAPLRCGTRLWICPSGAWPPDPAAATTVVLDPGLAFGTGAHPTTALCLEWLDGEPLAGRRVIDYGCGSGILAVAALRLGAARAWAVDVDEQALRAAAQNAAKNRVAGRIIICRPETLGAPRADVVLANILANPLIELAPRLAALLGEGGRLVLSGILAAQGEAVWNAYRPWFDEPSLVERDGWVRLSARRRSA